MCKHAIKDISTPECVDKATHPDQNLTQSAISSWSPKKWRCQTSEKSKTVDRFCFLPSRWKMYIVYAIYSVRFDGQIGPAGHLPHSPYHGSPSRFPSISMANTEMEVQVSPIWTIISPLVFHQTFSNSTEKLGCSSYLPGRYSNSVSSPSPDTILDINLTTQSGFPYQLRKHPSWCHNNA
ncbi:Hypothetical predicted protein [Pelobates cultripes]|uniref:Uncharacterized protein n=1 Tax=Pelobates cultripes TaxID=61616 RepID=A0AAD1RCI3_PELCU|nr:Hypothetical predicted protein [Pelobates cultripes]